MIEIYGNGPSRWAKCYWMLKELGVEFKEHRVNFAAGEHKSAKILAMNPFGKLPVMKDGDVTLFESTAIINYLGEKYPQMGLVPKSGTTDRAYYDQWMSYCITELEQPLWRLVKHTRMLPEAKRIAQDVDFAKEEFAHQAKILDGEVGDKKFIAGNKFTAADITLGYTLGWANGMEMLTGFNNLQRYLKEMSARPAFPTQLFAR